MRQIKYNFKKWLVATLVRAVKTFAETMIGFLLVGYGINDVQWTHALSVSVVATLGDILLSLKGLPEVDSFVDETNNKE